MDYYDDNGHIWVVIAAIVVSSFWFFWFCFASSCSLLDKEKKTKTKNKSWLGSNKKKKKKSFFFFFVDYRFGKSFAKIFFSNDIHFLIIIQQKQNKKNLHEFAFNCFCFFSLSNNDGHQNHSNHSTKIYSGINSGTMKKILTDSDHARMKFVPFFLVCSITNNKKKSP